MRLLIGVHKPVNSLKCQGKSHSFASPPQRSILLPQRVARVFTRKFRKMPIQVPVESEQETLGPNTIEVLVVAFEDTLRQLRFVDRNDPAMTPVAKKIIELAKRGERDPIRLRDQAIQSFRYPI